LDIKDDMIARRWLVLAGVQAALHQSRSPFFFFPSLSLAVLRRRTRK